VPFWWLRLGIGIERIKPGSQARFNNERPHEALEMKCPAEVYQPSPRPYTGLADRRFGINKEAHDDIWLVGFMDYDLGYIDLEEKTLQPLNNPFGPKVYVFGTFCKGCLRTAG
jgi:hypothetical protein